jgi:hypothetical protein
VNGMNRKEKFQGLNEVKDLEMSKAHLLTADAVRKDYVFLLTSTIESNIITMYEKQIQKI